MERGPWLRAVMKADSEFSVTADPLMAPTAMVISEAE
jgi:hypothetical protein